MSRQCTERYSVQVRCEEAAGHLDEQRPHFNSFFMRSWEEPRRHFHDTDSAETGWCSCGWNGQKCVVRDCDADGLVQRVDAGLSEDTAVLSWFCARHDEG